MTWVAKVIGVGQVEKSYNTKGAGGVARGALYPSGKREALSPTLSTAKTFLSSLMNAVTLYCGLSVPFPLVMWVSARS